jgi:hypothetical protein
MVGDQPTGEAGLDPLEVGADIDHPIDRRRVDGVVVAENRRVVVPADPDPVAEPGLRVQRRQREHRLPVQLDQLSRAGLQRSDRSLIRSGQPGHQLGVEVVGVLELAAGHERGLQELVGSLDDALGLRIEGLELNHPGRQRSAEPGDALREMVAAADAGLVIPDQSSGNGAQLPAQQRPHARQQIRCFAGRQHPRGDEP